MTTTMTAVKLPNGVRLPYVEQGDPSGVPVLFLHGYTDSWWTFEGVLRRLPRSIRAIALTQRGHGDADRPETGYHPRDFAADAAAVIDVLGLGPAVIAGHSMGSTVARQFALDYPERTRALLLMGSFATPNGNPELWKLWETVMGLTDPIDPEFVREFQESMVVQPVPPRLLTTAIEESLKLPARVWKAALYGFLQTDLSSEHHRIQAPTLNVWGDQDLFCPRSDQEALLREIPESELLVYPGTGHSFHWEQPERFAADLVGFAERVSAGRP